MATTYLTRTSWGTATNRQKFTQSFWVKRGVIGVQQALLGVESGGNNEARVLFRTDDTFEFYDYQSGYTFRYITNRKFRDCSAWYNIVLRVDTDNGTVANRVRIYINGVQETSFSTATQPSRNLNTFYNSSGNHIVQIGRQSTGNSYFTGSMSHVNFLDGEDRDGSFFGSTDATTGEWEIKTTPSGVNYGTNGYFILKDGNTITDSSANSNNFSLGAGTLTNTKDCPSNVLATFNSLIKATTTFSNGNTTGQTQNSSNYLAGMSTLGMPKNTGIYYCEIKLISESSSGESCIGVASEEAFTLRDAGTLSVAEAPYNWGLRNQGREYYNGSSADNKHGGFAAGNIMGVYFDSTNNKLTFSKNGGWWNGTSSWSGNSPDLSNYFVGTSSGNYQTFFFNCGDAGNTANAKWSANFGNGYFGTTAVSSAGTNTSGQVGIFEYNMPSNSKVLSTKGLNT